MLGFVTVSAGISHPRFIDMIGAGRQGGLHCGRVEQQLPGRIQMGNTSGQSFSF